MSILVLSTVQEPAVFSAKVGPICLPRQGEEHRGLQAVAAGWGRWHMDSNPTSQESFLCYECFQIHDP